MQHVTHCERVEVFKCVGGAIMYISACKYVKYVASHCHSELVENL